MEDWSMGESLQQKWGIPGTGLVPTYMLARGTWCLLLAVDEQFSCDFQCMGGLLQALHRGAETALGRHIKRKENVIYLANHQSIADWIISNILSIWPNALGHMHSCSFLSAPGHLLHVKPSAKFNEKEM